MNVLNERITFRSQIAIPDEMGGRVLRWADSQTVWAWVEAMRYGPVNLDSDRKSPARSVYRVRVRAGIDFPKAEQVKWRNKIMRILTRPVTLSDKKLVEFQMVEEA